MIVLMPGIDCKKKKKKKKKKWKTVYEFAS